MRMNRTVILVSALWWLALGGWAHAGGLPTGQPEEVGLSSERLGKITQMLRANAANGEIPGAVLLIARHGKIAYFENIGFLDPQAKSPMPKDAIFRIYSMSKPITTVAAMILFEEGKITLDEPIGKYIPALAKPQVAANNNVGTTSELALVPANRPISIQDLMRLPGGLPACLLVAHSFGSRHLTGTEAIRG